MKFETLGNKENPAVLLIHGMLCTGEDCKGFGKYLADEYYIILPTLDGHGDDGTDLLTVEDEAEKILGYLKENGIKRLALLQGSSMGAEVALEVLDALICSGITVDRCFFDGGPFFDFNPVFREVMYKKFSKLVKVFDTDDPEEAVRRIKENSFFKFVAQNKIEQFEPMIRSMAQKRKKFSDKTVKGMVKVCYECKLPYFTEGEQRRMIFFHSNDEPAKKSRGRLMKAYPAAVYRGIRGYSHCGLQINKPKAYAQLLRKAIKEGL